MKKIWCEVWDHVVPDERCLFEMGKMAEKNKTCENCIYFENLRLRARIGGKVKKEAAPKKKRGPKKRGAPDEQRPKNSCRQVDGED